MTRRDLVSILSPTKPAAAASSLRTGLEPYRGPWGYAQAAHLLRRTTFGAPRPQVAALVHAGIEEAVASLFAEAKLPDPPHPVRYLGDGSNYPGDNSDWSRSAYVNTTVDLGWFSFFQTWHFKQIVDQQPTVHEKLILFWHNHFSTAYSVVKDARYMFRTHQVIREHALGNFRAFVKAITLDPGMLRYLDGNVNTTSGPNENYGRELQELFTIGKGPEVAPGNYSTYTESDIKQAARVLSGWSEDFHTIETIFTPANHDSGDKRFSACYGNTVIAGRTDRDGAAKEIDELIEMILRQPATSEYICRKLYRWFVSTDVSPSVEAGIIKPLAKTFRESNFEIAPVMQQLLTSAHFYDPAIRGAIIKHPVDLAVGIIRMFPVDQIDDGGNFMSSFPSNRPQLSSDIENIHYALRLFRVALAGMQFDLHNPPSVAGYPAYYQEPQFQKLWINASTLQQRVKMIDDLVASYFHFDTGYGKVIVNVAKAAKQLSHPADPAVVVRELVETLFAIEIAPEQRRKATAILLDGITETKWAQIWNEYVSNPDDPVLTAAVAERLRPTMRHLMGLAEYQLM